MDKGDVVYIPTVEYYSSIKKNEIILFAVARMNLEITILGKVSQIEKHKCHMISLACGIYKKDTNYNLLTKHK